MVECFYIAPFPLTFRLTTLIYRSVLTTRLSSIFPLHSKEELEHLNQASDEINKLELQLDVSELIVNEWKACDRHHHPAQNVSVTDSPITTRLTVKHQRCVLMCFLSVFFVVLVPPRMPGQATGESSQILPGSSMRRAPSLAPALRKQGPTMKPVDLLKRCVLGCLYCLCLLRWCQQKHISRQLLSALNLHNQFTLAWANSGVC